MTNGIVKWFDVKKGYGFISRKEGEGDSEGDIFVHYSAIKGDHEQFRTLNEGDEVEFEVGEGKKGPEAKEVVVTKRGTIKNRKRSFSRG